MIQLTIFLIQLFLISGGQTLHSAFSLDFAAKFTSLDDKKRDRMRNILKNLRLGNKTNYDSLASQATLRIFMAVIFL